MKYIKSLFWLVLSFSIVLPIFHPLYAINSSPFSFNTKTFVVLSDFTNKHLWTSENLRKAFSIETLENLKNVYGIFLKELRSSISFVVEEEPQIFFAEYGIDVVKSLVLEVLPHHIRRLDPSFSADGCWRNHYYYCHKLEKDLSSNEYFKKNFYKNYFDPFNYYTFEPSFLREAFLIPTINLFCFFNWSFRCFRAYQYVMEENNRLYQRLSLPSNAHKPIGR